MRTKVEIAPTNEQFLEIVKKYYERFPSVCGGSLANAGIVVSNYYRDEGVPIDDQYEFFVLNVDKHE